MPGPGADQWPVGRTVADDMPLKPVRRPGLPRVVHPRATVTRAVARTRPVSEIARATMAKAWHDRVLGLSAEAAFWQLLSMPPLVLALLGTLGYAGRWTGADLIRRVEGHILRLAGELVSPAVQQEVVAPVVSELLRHGRGGVATLGVVIALWAGSSSTATYVNTVSIAYGQRELRGAMASRLLALWLYLCTLATALVAVPLLLLGPDVLVSWLPADWHDLAAAAIQLLYWPLTAVLVFAALSAFYHFATPVRLAWRSAIPGAGLALALFLLFSWVLRLYIGAVAARMLLFSTLAAPIVALLYFYALALAVLLGAELNGTLEARWPSRLRDRRLHRISGRLVRISRPVWNSADQRLASAASAARNEPADEATRTPDEPAGHGGFVEKATVEKTAVEKAEEPALAVTPVVAPVTAPAPADRGQSPVGSDS